MRSALCLPLLLAACHPSLATELRVEATYDLVLSGGTLVDGTGAPPRRGDVAVSGGRIVAIDDLGEYEAVRVLDVSGLHVAPGFIDAHSHAAGGLISKELSGAAPLLAQGVTTVVLNPDGGGAVDLARQREALLEHGLGVNVVQLVPFGAIRREVLGMEDRAPTSEELGRMKELVRAGFEAGGFGFSTGLFYAPQSFAATEEVIELTKIAAEYDGVYHSHIRDEADYSVGLVAAVDEVIRIAREARVPGIVSHVKALGPRVWGLSGEIVARIDAARREGVEIFADQYPYDASQTSLGAALVPRWAQADGRAELRARLENAETRARIHAEVLENLERRGGAARLVFAGGAAQGRTLADVAEERGLSPADTALALVADGDAAVISFNMREEDVRAFLTQPWTMTSSDGGLVAAGRGRPHPRGNGAFARKIRRYVVDEEVVSLAQAVRSATGLTAEVFRLEERGVLRAGAVADIVVFDLERLRDKATYEDPHLLAEGVVHVFVNGQVASTWGVKGPLSGRVLAAR